ncbi:MAG: SEL1-like repeat protein [Bacteroidaceae bacterium]|nr:SEL1-like repeat protein [Bacteroidaceae bacterium]
MKYKLLFFIGCVLYTTSVGAYQPDDEINKEIGKAVAWATGSGGRINRNGALQIFQKYATLGHPKAMNGLGLMYLQGHEVQADSSKAIDWLTRAGEAGYARAWQNLGLMYFYAHGGVQQDFIKAYNYFEKGVQAGGIGALYDAGYMLYKGLGCTQDYQKAFAYFVKGAGNEHSPCMYMLGLCYRNGYGVEANAAEANYWLTEAEKLGYAFASNELEAETPENSLEGRPMQTSDAINVPTVYARIKPVQKDSDLAGIYQGILVTYDWSGQHILSETPLQLILQTDGERVQGEWQTETDTVQLNATFKDGILHFENTQMKTYDHYSPTAPVLYEFTEAKISAFASSLTGNLRMFSPQTMEPQRPMYISLHKVGTTTVAEDKEAHTVVKAYPNPFSDKLNLALTLQESCNVQIAIYDYSGRNVYMTDMGDVAVGEQRFVLTPNLSQGVYIVKAFAGKRTYQVIVIKKGGKQ